MNSVNSALLKFFRISGLPIVVVYVILITVFMILVPRVFTNYMIYMSFLQTVPPELVLAMGLTLVICAGEIDLSFSSVIAFSGFLLCYMFKVFHQPWLGFILALAGGALVGYINGIMVAKVGVPSIMATLAAQFFWQGVTILLCGGLSWNIKEISEEFIHTLFVGRIFGLIPAQSLWAAGLSVFIWFMLKRHKFGEAILFIGDNANVARVTGINVENTKIKLFTLNGLIGGFAAVLLTLEMVTFWTTQGSGFLMPVIAAVFIGGTSITGGEASILGTFFGSYIYGSLEAGVVATGAGIYYTKIVIGLVMGASIALNVILDKSRNGSKKLLDRVRNLFVFKRPDNKD